MAALAKCWPRDHQRPGTDKLLYLDVAEEDQLAVADRMPVVESSVENFEHRDDLLSYLPWHRTDLRHLEEANAEAGANSFDAEEENE